MLRNSRVAKEITEMFANANRDGGGGPAAAGSLGSKHVKPPQTF